MFLVGSAGGTVSDSRTFVLTDDILGDDINVISWIDAAKVENLGAGASTVLVSWLNDPLQCHLAVLAWTTAGNLRLPTAFPYDLQGGDDDRQYANYFCLVGGICG